MKKLFFFFFGLFINHVGVAQIATIFNKNISDTSHYRAGITGDLSFNASSLTSQFVYKFYTGQYIDDDTKNRVLNLTKNTNRVGEDFNYGVFGAIRLDSLFNKKHFKHKFTLFFGLFDRQHFDALYSKDFYKVAFYGNEQYAGQTANLNGFNLNFIRYQQLQVGLYSAPSDTTVKWGIGISFLKGEQFASINVKTAELYTSPDGQYINFNTSMQVAESDTAHKGIGAFNGYGASVSLYIEAPFKGALHNSKIRVSVDDLGAIAFNKKSLYLNQDSLFHYSGFKINNITDLKDSTFGQTNRDSITKRVAPFRKQVVNVTLPTVLNVVFETQFSKLFCLTEGVRYVYNANYTVLYYVKGGFTVNKHLNLTGTVGFGGYGKMNYGVGVFYNFGKGFLLYAGSNDVEGFVSQKTASGIGAYTTLIKVFK